MGAGPPTFRFFSAHPAHEAGSLGESCCRGTTACICSLRVFCMKASSSSLVSTLCMCSSGCLQAHQPGKHVLHQRCAPVAVRGCTLCPDDARCPPHALHEALLHIDGLRQASAEDGHEAGARGGPVP